MIAILAPTWVERRLGRNPDGVATRVHNSTTGKNNHASIALCGLDTSRLLDERASTISTGPSHPRSFARVPWRYLQDPRLPAHPHRGNGRPRARTRAFRPHNYAGGMGKGTETRLEPLAERGGRRLRGFPMARRLCGLFGESIQVGPGKELYCGPGNASPEDGLSGRASLIASETRCRMGRTVCVGLSRNPDGVASQGCRTRLLWVEQRSTEPSLSMRNPNGVASPHGFTMLKNHPCTTVIAPCRSPPRWLRIDPLTSRPAEP